MSLEKGVSDHWCQATQRDKEGEKWTTQAFSVTVFVTAQVPYSASESVFNSGHHAVLKQEEHHHGTLITFYAPKSLNTR